MDKKNSEILLKQIKQNKNKKIIFWGASLFLEKFINDYNLDEYQILGIVDINPSRWGNKVEKYQIFNPEKLNELKPDCIIIAIHNLNKRKNKELTQYIKETYPNIKLIPNKLIFRFHSRIYKYSWFYKFLDFIIPKNKKKIIFLSYPDFSDNAREYYEYLNQYHKDEYKLVWLYENRHNSQYLSIKNRFFISDWRGIFHLLTSKYIVYTGLSLNKICNFRRHKLLQLWHGMPLKTLGFTEKNISEDIYKKYQKFGKTGYFFVSSDIFKLSMIACFLMNPNRVYITGQPKTDCILTDRNKEKIEKLIEPHKYNNVIIYAPTYKEMVRNKRRDIEKTFENIFYFDDYSKTSFFKYLEEKNILFLIKPHPIDEPFYRKISQSKELNHSNIKIFFESDMKINDVYFYDFFKFADLMITDFSSIAIDWLISKKPVIFLNALSNEYSQNRGFILEDNYEILMPGYKAATYQELINVIDDSLTVDSYKEQRLKKLHLLYKYIDNKSSERIYEIMKGL